MKKASLLYNSRALLSASTASALLFASLDPLQAATDTWTGGSSSGNNWSDPANWGGTAPSPGDFLNFSGSTRTSPNNDYSPGTIFGELNISNDAAAFILGGNLFVLTNGSDVTSPNPTGGSITNFSLNTQTLNLPITLSAGKHFIDTEFLSGSPSGDLDFTGPFTRNTGATAMFGQNGGNINFTGSGLANINGILGGWATFVNASGAVNFWAALDGSGNIVQSAGSADVTSGVIPNDPTANVRHLGTTATISAAANTSINALMMAASQASTLTYTNALKFGPRGGIFRPSTASGNMIVQGPGNTSSGTNFITVPGGGELTFSDAPFTATANNLTINGIITNDGANVVSVSLVGYVVIAGNNRYSGGTYINQGRVQASNTNSFGTGPVYVFPGGEAFINQNNAVTNDFYISGIGTTETSSGQNLGAIRLNNGNGAIIRGTITLLANSRISAASNNVIASKITGPGRLELTAAANPITNLFLSNTNLAAPNDFAGGLLVTAGGANRWVPLRLGANDQIPDGPGKGDVTLNGTSEVALIDLNGFNETINGLNSALSPRNQIANFGTNVSTLIFGGNNATGIFGGNISDGGFATSALNLLKIGTGTQTLQGANTHIGTTTVAGGTLLIDTGATIPNSTNIVVMVGANLDSSGVNPLTLNAGQAVTLTGGTNTVTLVSGGSAITTPSLTVSGSNTIAVFTIPPIFSFPQQFTVIKSASPISGAVNFGLAPLPHSPSTPYTGYVSNNVANNSIDVVIGTGPLAITWAGFSSGSPNSSWDTTTPNWRDVSNTQINYVDGNFALFNDKASNSTVTVNVPLSPAGIIVSNNVLTYTFGDNGSAIGGLGNILKQGTGTLILDNTTQGTYAGDVLLNSGTIQVGNHDTGAGSFSTNSTIFNNGALVFSRNDNLGVSNSITGKGTVTMNGSGILTLAAANSFTGAVSVISGTLQVGDNSALGTTNGTCTISSGATLDVNGSPGTSNTRRLGNKQFFASGTGVNGNGAIINTGGDAYPAMSFLTLQGDTTLGANTTGPNNSGRWDLRSPGGTTGNPNTASLSTSGQAYNLTKVGSGFLGIVSCTVDPALANIDVQGGVLDIEGNTTSLGDPTKTLTIENGAALHIYEPTNRFLKNIVLQSGGNITNVLGTNIINGPITVNGSSLFQITGTSLSINGTLGGPGNITKTLFAPLIINGDASGLAGGINVQTGNLTLNGLLHSTATVQGIAGTNVATISGTGTNLGLTDVFGVIYPGAVGVPGTFTTGGLTLESGSTNVFDVTNNTAVGGGTNDFIQVNGDLTASGVTIYINPLVGRLANGTYHLINYTGALVNGTSFSFSGVQLLGGVTRYGLALDYSTTNWINLVVTGGPSVVEWNTAFGTVWDTFGNQNWSNETTHLFPDYFYAEDTAIFDDTPGVITNITISGSVSPFAVTNNSSANYFTFGGSGKITGTATIAKQGASTLTINTGNDFTGPVVISGGTLSCGAGTALGATNGSTTVTNGGTLDVGGQALGLEPVFVSGAGVGGNGAIVNNGVQQIHALRSVTLIGDTTFGGPGGAAPFLNPADGVNRWDIRAASTGATNETGTYLSTGGNNYTLTKIGSNQMAFVSAAVDTNLGNIHIIGGMMDFELNTTGMGNPTNTCTVESTGVVGFYNDPFPFNKVFVLNGDGAGMINLNNSNTLIGPIKLTGSNVFTVTGNSLTLISNTISGTGSLNLFGGGALIIWDTNAYTGDTLINTGRLALIGSTSLTNSPNITLGTNSVLDVSARTDKGLTLISGQTLSGIGTVRGSLTNSAGATVSPGLAGSIGTLTVTNVVNLQGTTSMALASGSNDMISAGTVYYGGQLNLTFTPGSLALGNAFKLFNASSGSYVGSFASINPASPGGSLLWDTASLNSSGILRVTQPSASNPTNLTAIVSGGNLNLSWPADHLGWRLKVQTNSLNAGLGTNWFDVEGTANVTSISIPINTTAGTVFYRMTYP